MRSFGILSVLIRRHRSLVLWMLVAGALSGLFSAAVVAVINRLLHQHDGQLLLLAVGFAGFASAKVTANLLSQLWLARFTQDAVLEVTTTLCEKILRSPLRIIERAGIDEVFTTLTDDVGSVVWAAQCVPQLAMNGAMVAGCVLYLIWLSPAASVAVAAVTGLGGAGYYWLHRKSLRSIRAAREAKASVVHEFRGLTVGIKELLMDTERGRNFIQHELHDALVSLRRSTLAAWRHHVIGEGWTQSLYYLTIGLILIVFPASLNLTDDSLTGFVFAILYLMNPVWGIINALPAVSRSRVALARIDALGKSMKPIADCSPASRLTVPAVCPVVVLQGVTFSYDPVGGQPGFTLGPVDFTIRPGEVVFIVGGNGSGKSTFVKLLTGLYRPDEGTISLGGLAVTDANREWYRTHFAAVFSDFHVFDRLPFWGPDTKELVNTYLSLLELEGKVIVTDGRWSTTNLSQGQRRRLALLTAYVENRSVYVFDEWAADQDPHYKSVFYNRLLPELSGRGKAVVVITHDDRYFSLGDRVVKLEDGRVVGVVSQARQPAGSTSL